MSGRKDLDYYFYPESLAVIGASTNTYKAGYQIVKNMLDYGFTGKVYPVNPKEKEVLGLSCYQTLNDIPGNLDLIIIAVPSSHVLGVMKEAAARGGIKAAVVVAAGFAETKVPELVELEKEIVATARQAGIRVFGPNCVGIQNTRNFLDTTIEPPVVKTQGDISIITQSGAMGGTTLLFMEEQPAPLGFSKWAHVGNMSDVDVLEILEYYGEDQDTRVVGMYMEGIRDGQRFREIASKVTKEKPVIILKVGRSEIGSRAAASHTGALAGSDKIYDAAFAKCGVTRVDYLEELVDVVKGFSMQPLPQGNRVCILTEAGGPGIVAVDQLGFAKHAELAHISEEGRKKLEACLPSMAMICHPDGYIDITAAAMSEHHADALNVVLDEPGVDAVLLITVPPTFLPPVELAQSLLPALKAANKPVFVCFLAGKWCDEANAFLEANGIPTFKMPSQAVRVLDEMMERKKYLDKIARQEGGAPNA
ncbi:MAG: acetate--CoA ligase family protein [Desulfitobacteriaceae bacterium]